MLDKNRPTTPSAIRLSPVAPATAATGATPASRSVAPDQASLSTRARELSLAHEAARQAPEVRAERVTALRQRIAAGAYRIPDALLADALLDVKG